MSKGSTQRSGQLNSFVFRAVDMRQQSNRLVGVAVAGVAPMAIKPAPVGVIVMTSNKIVDLWNAIDLHALTRGTAPSGEVEGVIFVELFFEGEKIGKARIGYAFDITHLCAEPRRCRCHHRPSVFELP